MTGTNDDVDGAAFDTERYTAECTWDQERGPSPSTSVVTAVADATGQDTETLRPLFEVIDPDALDALFEATDERRTGATDGFVTFEYNGCSVRVSSAGRTVVAPVDRGDV